MPIFSSRDMTNLHLESAKRYKEIIDDMQINDFELSTDGISEVQKNINGMYYGKPREPSLTKKSGEARRKNISNEASFNRIFLNDVSEMSVLAEMLPRTKTRVYNKEFLDDYINPKDRNYEALNEKDFYESVEGRNFGIKPLLRLSLIHI